MGDATSTAVSEFEAVRGRLFGIAYRMLGSRAEAEDLVQDTYLRWHEADRNEVRSAKAWLVTTATRLAIDRLRRLKTEREAYVGQWLPEPLVGYAGAPDRDAEIDAEISIAFLVLLERLAPEERAAFLLHEVFDVGYSEIASILGRSEPSCRQIVHRARQRVRRPRKRFAPTERAKAHLLEKFAAAVKAKDERGLLALFAADATWTADGGGKTAAAPHPIAGAERIVKLVLGLREKYWHDQRTLDVTTVNGEPALRVQDAGRLTSVIAIDTDGDRIVAAYVIVNPDKLAAAARDPNTVAIPPSLR
jgi:RNA polymerase sigma-70 factor (ECF subfamily)